jgi:uncharacterized membrane protein YraQ (UPF0718 family)
MDRFIFVLKGYFVEILPALALGFFLSGLIHEFVPSAWVEKNLGNKGLKAVFYSTIIGTLLPICCWGALPVAVSFYKKGSKLGPILAFLVATPATSVSALIVTYRLLGLKFAVFIFFAVILMGMLIGIIGNKIPFKFKGNEKEKCPHCKDDTPLHVHRKGFLKHMQSVLKFAFWDMPREIGLETLLGIVLAAIVTTVIPLGVWIRNNLSGVYGYIFSLVFGLIMYICSTATVPLVDALIKQGMNVGAGMVLLLVGPITSYGTILVLKKEFGARILLIYLIFISFSSLMLSYLYSLL